MGFAIFDIETRCDKPLLKESFFPSDDISEEEAYQRFLEEQRNDFLPTSLHLPISIAVGNLGEDYGLRSVESLAESDYSEENLVREFWSRAERFSGCLVSFNGRRFDLPVLELAALRWGISVPQHFKSESGGRSRYDQRRHLDLMDFLTNYGAFQIRGGLNLLLRMIGMPGKGAVSGAMVQELHDQGRLADIHRYCRHDVIRTYLLFLRVELMRGRIEGAAFNAAHAASAAFVDELRAEP